MSGFGISLDGQKFINNNINQQYNVNTTHPLIPNSQQYILYEKFISIHSEDRNLLKYPNSDEFEIELPEDIVNVAALRLMNWSFPANYNTFSVANENVRFTYSITKPYNPSAFHSTELLNYRIYEALFMTKQEPYNFIIEEGFYNPDQITTELTNKLNYTTTSRIIDYFTKKNWTESLTEFNLQGGYNRFIVVYNTVTAKLWFGNRSDGFTLINENSAIKDNFTNNLCFLEHKHVPDSSNWGLPGYLGLPRYNVESTSNMSTNSASFQEINGITVPRFFYGDVTPGDNGLWLLPYSDFSGSKVYWVESLYKINLMGEAYMYLEIEGQNCIDETQPYNISNFTLTTNQTNGIVNSSFAKISIPTAPMSQWFDRESFPYKLYNPPLERIRKLKVKLRYHNGRSVNFGVFNYSFMLQFTVMTPQILRVSKTATYPISMGF